MLFDEFLKHTGREDLQIPRTKVLQKLTADLALHGSIAPSTASDVEVRWKADGTVLSVKAAG